MELRLDLLHRNVDGSCLVSFTVTDDDGEERFTAEVGTDEEGLTFSPQGELGDIFDLYSENDDPEGLDEDDARKYRIASLVDTFLSTLAESGLLDVVTEDEDDDEAPEA